MNARIRSKWSALLTISLFNLPQDSLFRNTNQRFSPRVTHDIKHIMSENDSSDDDKNNNNNNNNNDTNNDINNNNNKAKKKKYNSNNSNNNSNNDNNNEEDNNETDNKRKASNDDDVVTAEERRSRNRKSAYQSRLRKRLLIEELQGKAAVLNKELERLKEENQNLLHQMEMVSSENTRLLLMNQQESFMMRQHHQQQHQQYQQQQQQHQQQQQQHHHLMGAGQNNTAQQAGSMAQLNAGLGLGLGLGGSPSQVNWNGLAAKLNAAQMNAAQMNAAMGGGLGSMNGFHQQLAGLHAMQQHMGNSFPQGLLEQNGHTNMNGVFHGDGTDNNSDDDDVTANRVISRTNPNGTTEI